MSDECVLVKRNSTTLSAIFPYLMTRALADAILRGLARVSKHGMMSMHRIQRSVQTSIIEDLRVRHDGRDHKVVAAVFVKTSQRALR
ncbi:MAG: hypothetical protein ABIT38_17950 [Gemmatimonadaceae bacterium]